MITSIILLMVVIVTYGIASIVYDVKCKTIKPNGESSFIRRVSFYLKKGSIKIHFITSDDNDEPHTHPWDFKSLLIIPYKEKTYIKKFEWGKDVFDTSIISKYKPFTLVIRKADEYHKTTLYRIFGIKIPALTIGYYGEKKQLCSFCQELGYCKENPPKEKDTREERDRQSKMVDEFDPFNGYERIV